MKSRIHHALCSCLASAGLSLSIGTNAFAHHSAAMFDRDKTLTLTGTIKEFEWTSPHVWIWLVVPDEKGELATWGIEGNDPSGMSRIGWTKRTLNPGDKVSIDINPRKDGKLSGFFISVKLADGSVLKGGVSGPRVFTDPNATKTEQ